MSINDDSRFESAYLVGKIDGLIYLLDANESCDEVDCAKVRESLMELKQTLQGKDLNFHEYLEVTSILLDAEKDVYRLIEEEEEEEEEEETRF